MYSRGLGLINHPRKLTKHSLSSRSKVSNSEWPYGPYRLCPLGDPPACVSKCFTALWSEAPLPSRDRKSEPSGDDDAFFRNVSTDSMRTFAISTATDAALACSASRNAAPSYATRTTHTSTSACASRLVRSNARTNSPSCAAKWRRSAKRPARRSGGESFLFHTSLRW